MDPNENQPEGTSSRTITIHLTRDTLILVTALVLLTLAILLAVIFPPSSSGTNTPASTQIAQANTPTNPAARVTQSPASSVATNSIASPVPAGTTVTPSQGGLVPTPGQDTYPAPSNAPVATVESVPSSSQVPTPNLPTFSPFRPTTGSIGATSNPSGGQINQATGYPEPATSATPSSNTSTTTANTTPAGTTTTTRPPNNQQTTMPTDPILDDETETAAPTDDSFQVESPTTGAIVTPTSRPRPTSAPANESEGVPPTQRPVAPTAPPPPTPIPVDVIRGNVVWTAAQSPIVLARDQQIAPGATLVIEPGVEVRLATGVSIFVEGTLYALGKPGQPVRFVAAEGQRWEGLFGRNGSNIGMEHAEIRGGGAGGTVLMSEGGNLTLRGVRINDNGGHVRVNGSRLEMRDSEIAGNDLPYGGALEASYNGGGDIFLINNRIGGNNMSNGAAPVQINNLSPFAIVNVDIQNNLLIGQDGPNLAISTNGPFQGNLTCNSLLNGANGLSIRGETTQVPGLALNIRDNVIEDHTPPILPIYLEYGIGRGATSEIALDMRNNWWGSPLGPYEPDRHADGRGEAVGDNIEFAPWLTEPPACAPRP